VQVAKYTTTSLVYNGAKARIYGVDLDLKAKVTPEIELTGGLEWLHARYTEFPQAPYSVPVPDGGPQLYYASAAGKTLNNAPNATATLALDYLPHVSRGVLDLNLTASYSSEFFQEPDNFLYQPSYTLLNAAVMWTAPNGRLATKVYGTNLTNKAVATQLNTLPVPPIGYDVDYANPPRIYGIAVSYRF
jgi:outer membrane receptor protein involved in Fe transport